MNVQHVLFGEVMEKIPKVSIHTCKLQVPDEQSGYRPPIFGGDVQESMEGSKEQSLKSGIGWTG